MRAPRTISLYLVRGVLVYMVLGLLGVGLVFLSNQMLRFLDEFLLVGVTWSHFLTIFRCVVTIISTYTLPIAFLFGVLVAVGRMAADAEIIALRACGVGLRGLVGPVFAVGVVVSCLSWHLILNVEHRAKRELRDVLVAVTTRGTLIEPQRFSKFGDRVIYVQSRDRQNRLEGVLISDRSNPERPMMIFAERGFFTWDPELGELRFRLEKGDIHIDAAATDPEAYRRISFRDFEYRFEFTKLLAVAENRVRPKDMSMEELRAVVARAEAGETLRHMLKKNPDAYRSQIHRRFALPVAPMLFALVGVPLAINRGRGARSWGAILSGALMAVYYGLLTFSHFMAMEGYVRPGIALWMPNVLFGAAAIFLLRRAGRPGS